MNIIIPGICIDNGLCDTPEKLHRLFSLLVILNIKNEVDYSQREWAAKLKCSRKKIANLIDELASNKVIFIYGKTICKKKRKDKIRIEPERVTKRNFFR